MAARMAGRAFARRILQAPSSSSSSRRPSAFGFSFASPKNLPSRFMRRELLTMLPLHSATAKSRMVSRISGCSSCYEGIFLKWLTLCLENSQWLESTEVNAMRYE